MGWGGGRRGQRRCLFEYIFWESIDQMGDGVDDLSNRVRNGGNGERRRGESAAP